MGFEFTQHAARGLNHGRLQTPVPSHPTPARCIWREPRAGLKTVAAFPAQPPAVATPARPTQTREHRKGCKRMVRSPDLFRSLPLPGSRDGGRGAAPRAARPPVPPADTVNSAGGLGQKLPFSSPGLQTLRIRGSVWLPADLEPAQGSNVERVIGRAGPRAASLVGAGLSTAPRPVKAPTAPGTLPPTPERLGLDERLRKGSGW